MSSIFDAPLEGGFSGTGRSISFADSGASLSFTEALSQSRERFAKAGVSAEQLLDEPAGLNSAEIGAEMITRGDVRDNPAAYVRLAQKAYDQVLTGELTTSRQIVQEQGFDGIIRAVKRSSGVELENPLRRGYEREAGVDVSPVGEVTVPLERQIAIFESKLDELMQSGPEVSDAITQAKIDFAPAMIARRAQEDYEAAQADAPSMGGSIAASIVGGLPAMMRDPVNIAGLFIGGGESTAVSVVGRIAATMGREALVNAGLTAAAQPFVQGNRRELGLKAGFEEGLDNVAMAALLGGAFGGAIGGGRELARSLPATERGVIRHAVDVDRADTAAVADAPALMRESEGGRRSYQDAVAWGEDPYNAPPPQLVFDLPPAAADRLRITSEEVPTRAGDVETVDGKPATFGRFDVRELQTDAAAFQYKGGGDAAGVTDRLRSVTQWDPLASGKTLIFEARDGARFVADGHQRLGLGKRLAAQDPAAKIQLDGFLLREADGWTREDVRALAAKKNMQEGSGDAVDAARVLRDRPDLADGSLPTTAPMMRQALSLSRLSDDAWGMVVNGVVPASHGAAVGSMVADRLQHAGILSLLGRVQPETERAARLLIGEALEAGFTVERQIDLFGAADATRSLMAERVGLLDASLTALRKDKRLFGTLAQSADTIEAAGNALVRDTNEARAEVAARLEDILTRIARRSGPVSDALNLLASRLAAGEPKAKLAREFLDQVQGIVDKRGLVGLMADPQFRPAAIVEPGTPEAVRMAEVAAPARPAPEAAPARPGASVAEEPALQSPANVMEMRSGQAGLSVDDLHARASAFQPELAAASQEIAEAAGASFKNPGVKALETARDKVARKGYDDASSLTDLARGGFSVETPEQADAIVAALGQRFTILDEGWSTSLGGYTDRKVLVRGGNGVVAEVQIAAEAMWKAKKGGGQALYTEFRSMTDAAQREAMQARSVAFYSAAMEAADPAWKSVGGITSGPNMGSKVARQTGSDITPAVSTTSWKSTGDQPPSGLSTANALPAEISTTAGRQSQFTNDATSTASEPTMAVATPESNAVSTPAVAQGEQSLFDAVPLGIREDGGDARLMTREAALAEVDRADLFGDIVDACKG